MGLILEGCDYQHGIFHGEKKKKVYQLPNNDKLIQYFFTHAKLVIKNRFRLQRNGIYSPITGTWEINKCKPIKTNYVSDGWKIKNNAIIKNKTKQTYHKIRKKLQQRDSTI